MISNTHYSCAMDAEKLYSFASDAADALIEEADELGVGISAFTLCYSGMSGIALATAIQYELYSLTGNGIGMFYARKQGEVTHGNEVEFTMNATEGLLVFVDDFISSGETMMRTITDIKAFFGDTFEYSYVCLDRNVSDDSSVVINFANVQGLSLNDIVIQHTCL